MTRHQTVMELAGITISQGTLRDQDLLNAYANVIANLPGHKTDARKMRALAARVEQTERARWNGRPTQRAKDMYDRVLQEASEVVNEDAPDIVMHHVPDGYYVGSHEGDGALIGVWHLDPRDCKDCHDEGPGSLHTMPCYACNLEPDDCPYGVPGKEQKPRSEWPKENQT